MALAYTDLTKGILFIMDGAPYEVLESHFLRMQQRKAVVQTRIRNLMTGKILDRNFQPSDSFEEAEIERSRRYSSTRAAANTGSTKKGIRKTGFRSRREARGRRRAVLEAEHQSDHVHVQ